MSDIYFGLSMRDVTERLVMHHLLPERVATVEVQSKIWFLKPDGKWDAKKTTSSISSVQYALSCLRVYAREPLYLKQVFGADKDIEELQEDMLEVLWVAARGFLARTEDGSPWKSYLGKAMRTRLWTLDRRRQHKRDMGSNPEISLEEYLDSLVYNPTGGGDWESLEFVPLELSAKDTMYNEIGEENECADFLHTLTQRQREIAALLFAKVGRDYKRRIASTGMSRKAIAHKLGISVPTVRKEIQCIKQACIAYAKEEDDQTWLYHARVTGCM